MRDAELFKQMFSNLWNEITYDHHREKEMCHLSSSMNYYKNDSENIWKRQVNNEIQGNRFPWTIKNRHS